MSDYDPKTDKRFYGIKIDTLNDIFPCESEECTETAMFYLASGRTVNGVNLMVTNHCVGCIEKEITKVLNRAT